MDIVFAVGRQVVVDDQGDLLDVDTTSQEVGGDQDSGGAGTELAHDHVTLLLVHVAVLEEKTRDDVTNNPTKQLSCLKTLYASVMLRHTLRVSDRSKLSNSVA